MLELEVKQGDILDESADAIVSTANPSLLMSGGVNGAILERGGHTVQGELQAHLKTTGSKYVEPASVVVTGPGPLNCRHILHAVSINAFYESSSELVAQTLVNVFRKAAELGATSIAIPALATGYGPLKIEEFAVGLRDALLSFSDKNWLTSLGMRVVLWKADGVESIRRIVAPAVERINKSATNLPITNVAEVVLSVRDIPTMRDFYTTVLGFPLHSEACHETSEVPDPEGEPTISFLTIAETHSPLGRHGHPQLLVLIDHQRHVFARARLVGHDVTRSTLNHLAFEIPPESYGAWHERLTDLGLEPRVSEFPHMQARALFIKDPEGNTLELICHDTRI